MVAAAALVSAGGPAAADEPDGGQYTLDETLGDQELAAPQAGCSTAATGRRVPVDIGDRRYLVYVPAGLSGAAPLVVMVHGGYSSPDLIADETGFDGYADSKKFIVAYPQGPKPEGSGYGGWDYSKGSADVTFLRNVVSTVSGRYCVNPKRVHFVGHSNGGQMTSRMACDSALLVASAATYASYFPDGYNCAPARDISFGVMLAANDPLTWQFGAETNRDMWRDRNGCGAKTSESGYQVKNGESYACQTGSEVVYRVYNDQPKDAHLWPKLDDRPQMNADIFNRMWKLFVDNQL
ncbi:alpha/beta hydrolase family esterase [Nocardia sp. NPDC050406]|uniref:alpha/beta hydrolase family esterase n=1 Tax=Nocardia sp. NPDC050406 TaxID=3364318 RepID=UPI0037A54F45